MAPSPTVAGRQFVWGLDIDELILRDRSVNGVLNERLYGLQDANWNVVAIYDLELCRRRRAPNVYTPYGIVLFLKNVQLRAAQRQCLRLRLGNPLLRLSLRRCCLELHLVRHRWLNPLLGCWISNISLEYTGGGIHPLLRIPATIH